ncbi:hypothetical protein D1872_317510 [compost metagenome]
MSFRYVLFLQRLDRSLSCILVLDYTDLFTVHHHLDALSVCCQHSVQLRQGGLAIHVGLIGLLNLRSDGFGIQYHFRVGILLRISLTLVLIQRS